jgi:hypothetical protein
MSKRSNYKNPNKATYEDYLALYQNSSYYQKFRDSDWYKEKITKKLSSRAKEIMIDLEEPYKEQDSG